MILETIVSSGDQKSEINLAPMGIRIGGEYINVEAKNEIVGKEVRLVTYSQSHTRNNLESGFPFFINITDNIYHFCVSAVEDPKLKLAPAATGGFYIRDSCRALRVELRNASSLPENQFRGKITGQKFIRPFWGYNRAQNLLLEAVIKYTRLGIKYTPSQVLTYLEQIKEVVNKSGGENSRKSFEFLRDKIKKF